MLCFQTAIQIRFFISISPTSNTRATCQYQIVLFGRNSLRRQGKLSYRTIFTRLGLYRAALRGDVHFCSCPCGKQSGDSRPGGAHDAKVLQGIALRLPSDSTKLGRISGFSNPRAALFRAKEARPYSLISRKDGITILIYIKNKCCFGSKTFVFSQN